MCKCNVYFFIGNKMKRGMSITNRNKRFHNDVTLEPNIENVLEPGIYYPLKNYFTHYRPRDQKKSRIVLKTGEFNMEKSNKNRHRLGFLFNSYVTFVEARWRWTLIYFFTVFTGDWLFFALLYWLIALTHGDLKEINLPPNQNVTNWTPCVEEIYGFTSTFLFSVEVHTTLAYGKRSITLECPHAIFLFCIQCIASSFLQAFLVGILFAKLTRPKSRTQTILFSNKALICQRDGELCLLFRVGDIRKSRILNVNVSAYIITFVTETDKLKEFEQVELKLTTDCCESLFFLWPLTVIHKIDVNSPLYDVSAADLLCGKIEILVVFEGIIESTGQHVQARSSFTEAEILWGNRFVCMVKYIEEKEEYGVDFAKLCDTVQVDTPLCSAKEFENLNKEIEYLVKD